MLTTKTACNERNPCKHYDPCPRCAAGRYLTDDDWVAVQFYSQVSDQSDGMSGAPRLDLYASAAETYGYPEHLRSWLVKTAAMIHRLVIKTDKVNWLDECGKPYRLIGPGDVADG